LGSETETHFSVNEQGPLSVVVSERRRRLGLLLVGANIAVMATVCVVITDPGDWQPVPLLLVLASFTLASELLHVRRPKSPSSMDWVITGSAPLVLMMALLGPLPALVTTVIGMTLSDQLRGLSIEGRLANFANYATFIAIGGGTFGWLVDDLSLVPDELGFGALVIGLYVLTGAFSYVHNACTGALFWGESVVDQLSEEDQWIAVDLICAPLAAVTVYVYETVGLGALGVLALVQMAHQYIAGNLILARKNAERLRQQTERLSEISASRGRLVGQVLQAEEAERSRLAEALHDEALQNLLAAKRALKDPQNGGIEHASTGIDRTIEQLRGAIFQLHPDVLQHAGLGAALRAVARQEADRAGFQAEVEVDPAATGQHDSLLFVLAREQLYNAAKHSGATRVAVIISRQNGCVVMDVRDNGKGMDRAAHDGALEKGHIGLASSAERVDAVGGTFEIESAPGSGTLVRTTLPRRDGNGSVKDAAPHRLGDRS
jgi:signal transduction histidine kinase